jgi:cell division protein FtsX
VVIAVLGMLVGAAATTGVFLVVNRPRAHRYDVTVFLKRDATAEQKTAIESALHTLHPDGAIDLETRDEAYARFKEIFKDAPDLVQSTKAESLPESYRLVVRANAFPCPPVQTIDKLPGVDDIQIVQPATAAGQPGMEILCGV